MSRWSEPDAVSHGVRLMSWSEPDVVSAVAHEVRVVRVANEER